MFIALEPGETGLVWLERYNETPIESRRAFEFTAMSIRESRALARAFQALWAADNTDQQFDNLLSLLTSVVTGWQNYPVPFSRDVIEDHLSKDGAFEILRHIMAGVCIALDAKKN